MSTGGEESWFRIIKNPKVDARIYNFDQDKIYNIDDQSAIKPENDINTNIDKLNWFYMIESNIQSKFNVNTTNGICIPNYYD